MKLQGRNLSLLTPPLQGDDVKLLQSELQQLGFTIPSTELASATFGQATNQAVASFQAKNGLPTTGAVDAATAEKINAAVNALQPQRFVVQGQVRRDDGKFAGPTVVRAFAVTSAGESPLGEATTDAADRYKIEYTAAQLNRGPGQTGGPDLIVRAFDPSGAVAAASQVIRNAGPVANIDLVIQAQPVPSGQTFIVRGQVRQADFGLFIGAVVQASDKDLRSEEPLGQAITDQDGRYEIKYAAEQFRRAEKGSADLVVRVYANTIIRRPIDTLLPAGQPTTNPTTVTGAPAGTTPPAQSVPLVTSPVIFNAPPVATVDLVVGGATYPGPSEFEEIVSELTPLLQTDPPVQPADLTTEDIAFLTSETGLPSEKIQFFAAAARLAQQTALPAEVFYGFARENLPTELHALLAVGQQAQRRALQNALNDNVIPQQFGGILDEILQKLQGQLVTHALDGMQPAGQASLTALFSTVLPNPSSHQKLMTLYVQRTDSIEEFWKAVGKEPEFSAPGQVEALKMTIQLNVLAQNHLPMVQQLQRLRQQGQLSTLRELAKLDNSGWLDLINAENGGAKVGVPPEMTGKDDAEKAQNYAAIMLQMVERAFPTALIASRVQKENPRGNDLTRFFANSPDFEFGTSHIDSYVAVNQSTALAGVQAPEDLTKQLKAMQRVFTVAPSYNQMKALMDAGLNSARSIARMGKTAFVAAHADKLGGSSQAEAIFARAERATASALAVFGRFAPAMNSTDLMVTRRQP